MDAFMNKWRACNVIYHRLSLAIRHFCIYVRCLLEMQAWSGLGVSLTRHIRCNSLIAQLGDFWERCSSACAGAQYCPLLNEVV